MEVNPLNLFFSRGTREWTSARGPASPNDRLAAWASHHYQTAASRLPQSYLPIPSFGPFLFHYLFRDRNWFLYFYDFFHFGLPFVWRHFASP